MVRNECFLHYVDAYFSTCADLNLLQEPLYDSQQDVPSDHLQLFAVLLDESGDGEYDFVGHHFVGTGHGLNSKNPQFILFRVLYWLTLVYNRLGLKTFSCF